MERGVDVSTSEQHAPRGRAGRARRLSVAGTALVVLGGLVAAGCTEKKVASDDGSVQVIEVALTDGGCEPSSLSATAGPTTFQVSNEDAGGVTEFEVLTADGGRVLGETENIGPGLDGSFSLTLKAGSYQTYCPGGSKEKGTLEVAEGGSGLTGDPAAKAQAVSTYLAYVQQQADEGVARVTRLADAVKAGDLAGAQGLFAWAREPYESIEPIAESFGDLDPKIDAREGDVPADEWTGFHRIEEALWVQQSTAGLAPVADQLVADMTTLARSIPTVQLEPSQIANGAVELLNEVSASKITGEEDRYSHTDLADFAANVAGAKAAFQAVEPLLAGDEADLVATIQERFTDLDTALAPYQVSGGPANGYVLYTDLTPAQTATLAASVDALAEPLSRVAALVLQ
jgi:iron uptake system component EfeO